MSEIVHEALRYSEKGLCVIPINKNKKSMIKWQEYQSKKSTEAEIIEWWKQWPSANIGIVTGKLSGLLVIDVDSKKGEEHLSDYILDSLITPTAKTPRGGHHLYFKYPDEEITIGAGLMEGVDFRGQGGYIVAPPSENGIGRSYSWLEGLSIYDVPISAVPANLILYIIKNALSLRTPEKRNIDENVTLYVKGRRDNDIFHIANVLVKGKEPEWMIRQTLERIALSCIPPFPINEIPAKIQSALERAEKREINLTGEVREWISVTKGNFSVTDLIKSLQFETGVTKRNMGNVRMILHRLVKEGALARDPKRDGWFRRIESESEEIEWWDAEESGFKIEWPFGIEKKALMLKRNIAVIAGTQNAGKTAFLLNFAMMNMEKHKITYLSSEMADSEIKMRLKKFPIPLERWRSCLKILDRTSDFQDAIDPDGINVIDFLELTDEFYKIAGILLEIYKKLNLGIALIAIQKDPKKDYGRGGTMGLEKPRLYLNMDFDTLKIVKAKIWASELNPNGLKIDFKLINGSQFIAKTGLGDSEGWYRES